MGIRTSDRWMIDCYPSKDKDLDKGCGVSFGHGAGSCGQGELCGDCESDKAKRLEKD